MPTDSRFRQAELVSTGAELLSGRSLNSHARLLGARLGELGITLERDTTVPDNVAVIRQAVADAASRVDLVFVSGGLGPTNDDITRNAVADLLGREVTTDAEALEHIRARTEKAGRQMTPGRARQALVVAGATAWLNPVGAAPGERIEQDGKVYILLPGPPPELSAILDEHVYPWLIEQCGGAVALRERVLLVQGIGEGDIIPLFEQAQFPPSGITTAYCAGAGRVEVRLHPAATTTDAALDAASDQAATLLHPHVYARERIEPEALVAKLLTRRQETVAVAESCTGGGLAHRLTEVPGSSAFFVGGVIAYSNAVKVEWCHVNPQTLETGGAVSAAVAQQLASGVRQCLATAYGVGITGIAGPDGASSEKPVGLVYIAVHGPDGLACQEYRFAGNRTTIREQAIRAALLLLRRNIPAD